MIARDHGPEPRPTQLQRADGYWRGRFQAMASPCEVLVDGDDGLLANHLLQLAAGEAWRIEQKFSRYREDNIVHAINNSGGQRICVDEETADLLDFAAQCFEMSDGLFDVTSGVLRQTWRFDGSDRVPSRAQVQALLPRIGWNKLRWQRPYLSLPARMEIDLGGIGKEYAVDRALSLLCKETRASVLVNFGGDLRTNGPRRGAVSWIAGVARPVGTMAPPPVLRIRSGALATSGDAYRFLLKDGKRYSHVLDPRTGWPVANAPRSVTVAAETCTEAGMLATLALLQGARAERFLNRQGVRYWCIR